MGFDLGAGLRHLSNSPDLPAVPVRPDAVVSAVRRRRRLRTGLTTGLGAAAVVALAVTVQAAPWSQQDPPPAAPSPTQEPTADPSPEPSEPDEPSDPPEPDDTDAQTEAPSTGADDDTADVPSGPPPIIAVTNEGRLVELDPDTGAVMRVVLEDDVNLGLGTSAEHVSTTADSTHAYLTIGPHADARLVRVELATGAVETVLPDRHTSTVSPDGTTLAYVEGVRDSPDTPATYTLVLLDLTTGETHLVPDEDPCECGRFVATPQWAPDGESVLVTRGYSDWEVGTTDVTVVEIDVDDPPAHLDAAGHQFDAPEYSADDASVIPAMPLADGRILMLEREDAGAGWRFVVRGPDGTETRSATFETEPPWNVAVEPGGETALLLRKVGGLTRVTLEGERLWDIEGIWGLGW